MINYYFRTVKDDHLKEVEQFRTGVWIHAVEPSEDELTELFHDLQLDENLVEDARDFFEVPRLERSDGATYFFTRYPYAGTNEDVDTAPLLIVMGESFVLTVALREVPQFQKFLDGREVVHTTQKTKLFIQFMQAVTTSYERQLTRLRKAVHRDRTKLRRISSREIVQFVNYEHQLNDMVSALVPTNTWLQQVTKGNYIQLYREDVELMEDLMIDNSQLVDSARSVLKTIQNVRTASEAILTNKLNMTIRTLTVITVLLTLPMVVSSFYGMNVGLPLSEHPFAFWFIVLFVGFWVALAAWLFKRYEWF